MKEVTKTIYLYAKQNEHPWDHEAHPDGYSFDTWSFKLAGSSAGGSVLIAQQEITMQVPDDFDPVDSFVGNMRDEQEKLKAECSLKVDNIEQQIQSMLALPSQD